MHFSADWSGQPDAETAAIVFALLEKYEPESLDALDIDFAGNFDQIRGVSSFGSSIIQTSESRPTRH